MAKKRRVLDEETVEQWLQDHKGWRLQEGAIVKEFKFKSFRDSIVFVNRVATIADDANHHPDVDIRFSRVTISLTTHDVGGLTKTDLDVAKTIDFATSAR
ncbi:MAG: 4a-hydroxytetrahydrobiopterin dehydratase [Gemmatimonadota bacterium]